MLRVARFGAGQVDRLGSDKFDIRPRGIEVRVVRNHVSLLAHYVKENALSCATLVRGNYMAISEDVLHRVPEVVEALAAGIALIPFHHARPLVSRHGSGSGIGKQIDENVVGRQQKQVVARSAQQLFPLLAGGPANGLNALNAKRFDDGFCSHGRPSSF